MRKMILLILFLICATQANAILNFTETWTESNYSINGWSKCDWGGVSSSTPWVSGGFYQTIMSAGSEGSILSRNISNDLFDNDFSFSNVIRQNTTHVLNYGANAFINNCSSIGTYIHTLYLENKYNNGSKYDELFVGGDCTATGKIAHNSGFQLDVDYNYTITWDSATSNMTMYRNGSYVLSTIISCLDFSQFNLYIIMPRDSGYTRFNYSDMDIEEAVMIDDLVIYSPLNDTHSNELLNVSFNVSGSAPTYKCDLYVDSMLNTTKTATNDIIENIIVSGMTEGNHSWFMNCTNTTATKSSITYNYIYDLTSPIIQLSFPAFANDTIYYEGNFNITGNVSDLNLWRVNLTIYNSSLDIMYNNYSGNLISTPFYPLDAFMNVSSWASGIYSMFIDTADSHTGKTFEHIQTIEEIVSDNRYIITLNDDAPEIKASDGVSIDFYQETDKISFLIKANRAERKSFTFKTEQPLIKIEKSDYPCHYVFSKYWFDCAGLENPSVFELSENEILIEFDVRENPQMPEIPGQLIEKDIIGDIIPEIEDNFMVMMRSLGGLNENNKTILFELDNCLPLWTCSEFSICNMSNQRSCLNVTDNRSCGEAFTGLLSDYDDVCTFIDLSLLVLSPVNNTLSSSQLLAQFNINKLSNCTLYINGNPESSQNDIIGNQSFNSVFIFEGLYKWQIRCIDIFQSVESGIYNYLYTPGTATSVTIAENEELNELLLYGLMMAFACFVLLLSVKYQSWLFMLFSGFIFFVVATLWDIGFLLRMVIGIFGAIISIFAVTNGE